MRREWVGRMRRAGMTGASVKSAKALGNAQLAQYFRDNPS
jgi:hypothetical protein